MKECPDCRGNGKVRVDRFVRRAEGCKFEHETEARCERCDGDGFISEQTAERIRKGRIIREARQLLDFSLFEFAKLLKIPASELSEIETGKREYRSGGGYATKS